MRRHTFLFAGLVLAATLVLISDSRLLLAQQSTAAPPKATATQKTQITRDDSITPRTLEGYVEQEKPFYDYLLQNHPMFKYEKDGRMIGKYHLSDRDEEFVEEGGGKDYAKQNNRQVSMTYRLGMESILDLPNKIVGPKKCGECHQCCAGWQEQYSSTQEVAETIVFGGIAPMK